MFWGFGVVVPWCFGSVVFLGFGLGFGVLGINGFVVFWFCGLICTWVLPLSLSAEADAKELGD